MRIVQSAAAAARYGERPTCAAVLYPMAADAFAALGDRAGATVLKELRPPVYKFLIVAPLHLPGS